jgi:hypothetical protein
LSPLLPNDPAWRRGAEKVGVFPFRIFWRKRKRIARMRTLHADDAAFINEAVLAAWGWIASLASAFAQRATPDKRLLAMTRS